jgi:hypothetical protein
MGFWLVAAWATLCAVAAPAGAQTFSGPQKCSVCTAPTISGAGGLSNAEVVPIFWGNWPSGQATKAQILGAVENIMNGPYTGLLGQYGITPPRLSAMIDVNTSSTPTNDFSVTTVLNPFVASEIQNNRVPGPASGSQMFYIVFVPGNTQGCGSQGCTFGANSSITVNGQPIHYAFVGSQSGQLGGNNSYSEIFSHELVEGLTSGVIVSGCPAVDDQISDICECDTESDLGGSVTPQGYWSVTDGGCVLPTAWNGIYAYDASAKSWTQIGGEARQVVAGSTGVVATDTSDNVWLWTPSSNTFTPIGADAAMLAIGGDGVVGLASDLSSVQLFNGTSWTVINNGFSPAMVYAGSSFWSNGGIAASDWQGNPWLFNRSSNLWTPIGSPSDQFVAGNSVFFRLTSNHGEVDIWNSGTAWSRVVGSAAHIFGGSADNLLGGIPFGSQSVLLMWNLSGNWSTPFGSASINPLGPASTFALSGTGTSQFPNMLSGYSPDQGAVLADTQFSSSSTNWPTIGGAAGRVVSGGPMLIATGPATY